MAIKISGSTIIDDSRNIVSGAAATFTGNVTIAGTLTYEDVTNIDSVGIITARDHIIINADNKILKIGASQDLHLFHQGGTSIIKDINDNPINIQSDGEIKLAKDGNAETYARFIPDGAVELYHDNAKKFETTSTGSIVTGVLTATTYYGDGSNLSGITATGIGAIGGLTVKNQSGSVVGTGGSIATLDFNGSSGVTVTATSGAAGIATIAISGGFSPDAQQKL